MLLLPLGIQLPIASCIMILSPRESCQLNVAQLPVTTQVTRWRAWNTPINVVRIVPLNLITSRKLIWASVCGSDLAHDVAPRHPAGCDMTCSRHSAEHCGSSGRLSLYQYTLSLPTRSTTHIDASNAVSPVKRALPGTWTYAACYVDNANGRILGNQYTSNQMTVEGCISHCSAGSFTLAGIEYSVECCEPIQFLHGFPDLHSSDCGNSLVNGAVTSQESDCNMHCGGDAT